MSNRFDRRSFMRISGSGVLAAGLAGPLTACGGSESGSSGSNELVWWDYLVEEARQPGMKALIADIEKQVGVKITRRTFPFAELEPAIIKGAASGDLPDIAIVDNTSMNSFVPQGLLTDLTDRVKEWGQSKAYYEGPWNSGVIDGKTYSVPNNSNCLCLYYNTEMLEAAGVEPPKTWDELAEAAKKLTKGDTFGFAMSAIKTEEGVFQFEPFLWSTGGDLDTFGTDGAKALGFLKEMVDAGSLSKQCVGWTQQDANNQFVSGRAAMQINGPWQLPALQEQTKVKWGVVPIPVDKEPASCLGGENWVILKTSGKADQCWEAIVRSQEKTVLAKYLDGLGLLPARSDMADAGKWATDPTLKVFVQEFANARPRSYGPNYPQLSQAMAEALQASLTGSSSPQAAARKAASAITPKLQK
ncbi:sugar ABC transporter substrate-binding protein [Streptomyces pseudoechinosporeus]